MILDALSSIEVSLRLCVSVKEKQTEGQYVRIGTTKAKYKEFAALIVRSGRTFESSLKRLDAFCMISGSDFSVTAIGPN